MLTPSSIIFGGKKELGNRDFHAVRGNNEFLSSTLLKLINNLSIKTKEMITMSEVWIPGLNYHIFFTILFLRLLLSFLFRLRRYIKHWRQCFIGYSNTSNFVKNTPLRILFPTPFSVFGNAMKHCLSCLIYYILSHHTLSKNSR